MSSASGKLGGIVASHNRGGAYFRTHVVPTKATTADAMAAKARLSNLSTAFNGLTVAQQAAWNAWASTNPIVDRIGNQQILQANAAYIAINARLVQASESTLSAPPLGTQPDALTSVSLSLDIGAGSFGITFAPTPLGATERLWLQTCVTDSPTINYVTNLLRVTSIEAAATVSPIDFQTSIEAKFGTLVVGQTVHVFASVLDNATGQLSRPLRVSGLVTTT
jgi:hypothetical protein